MMKTENSETTSRSVGVFPPGSIVSLVGGGGKTSALFSLARRQPIPVLLTTTTKVGVRQIEAADLRMTPEAFHADPDCAAAAQSVWVSELTGDPGTQKIIGLSLSEAEKIAAAVKTGNFTLIIEADGAHRRAIKAPADYEPVVPPQTGFVVACIGLSVLDQPADETTVHRLPLFLERTGAEPGAAISEETILNLVRHPLGAFKGTPTGAEKILLLNQADTDALISRADLIAKKALCVGVGRVWVSCLKRNDWIAEYRADKKSHA